MVLSFLVSTSGGRQPLTLSHKNPLSSAAEILTFYNNYKRKKNSLDESNFLLFWFSQNPQNTFSHLISAAGYQIKSNKGPIIH